MKPGGGAGERGGGVEGGEKRNMLEDEAENLGGKAVHSVDVESRWLAREVRGVRPIYRVGSRPFDSRLLRALREEREVTRCGVILPF